MNQTDYWLWLTLNPKLITVKIKKLLEIFFSPYAVYAATEKDFLSQGLLVEAIEHDLLDKSLDNVHKVKEQCEKQGIKILTYSDELYPEKLKQIYDSPYVLYYKGTLPDFDNRLSIAVVGSRKSSAYGTEAAQKISYELAEKGVVVISGMARGIDSFAHKGALYAGGLTVAVVGSGIDIVYPPENRQLMEFIIKNGAVISEYPPGTKPLRYNFPQRNRLMSGLSEGVLVVEAAMKSGTFITVDFAQEQGKDVFAVPGSIFAPQSKGTNSLICDGTRAVTCGDDIISSYNTKYQFIPFDTAVNSEDDGNNTDIKAENRKIDGLSDEENLIISSLSFKPKKLEEIAKTTGLSVAKLTSMLTMLEMKGYVEQQAMKSFVLTNI